MVKIVKAIHQEHIAMLECLCINKQFKIIHKPFKQIQVTSIIYTIEGFVIKKYINIKKQCKILLKKLNYQVVQHHIFLEAIAMILWDNLN
jgi:hypothetical protein